MFRTPTVLLSLLGAAACASTPRATSEPSPPSTESSAAAPAGLDYDQMLQAAQSYIDAGRPKRAAEVAAKAAGQRPEAPEAHVVWGRALLQQQKLEESAGQYEKARVLGSRDRRLFVELSSVYDVSQKYAEAIAVYRDFLVDHPKDSELRHELALTLLLLGEHDAAVTELQGIVKLVPKSVDLKQDLGYALLMAGRLGPAARELQAVLKAEPKRHQALQFLAQVRARQGRSAEALKLLDRAVQVGRTDPAPVRLRAKLKALTGDHGGALADYEMLIKAKPEDAGAHLGASGSLIALGKLEEAAKAVNAAKTIVGEHPVIAFREAQLAWRRGDRAAVATISGFAESHPQSLEAWRDLKAAAKKFGDRKLAKLAAGRLAGLEKR